MRRVVKNSIIIMCCSIGGLLTSCTNYSVQNGRVLPKAPDYQLKGKLDPGATAGVLDPNAIYVFQDAEYRQGLILHFYYRFWEDGHVYQSAGLQTPPTRKDAESFYRRMVGYYTLEGQTLLIELFAYSSGSFGGRYYVVEAEIVGDDILVKKEYSRAAPWRSFEYTRMFRKVDMGPLSGIPDW